MRIAVIGSSGRTGDRVVGEALARRHEVVAVARTPPPAPATTGLTSAAADVLDPDSLKSALAGTDAVVSAIGIGTSREPTVLYSQGTMNILSAMHVNAIRKLTVISAAPIGPRNELPFAQRRLVMPILDRIFGATYLDMRRMEELLTGSDVDWVALRPPRLLDKPGKGRYRVATDGALPRASSITYSDLAAALIDCLNRGDLYRQRVWVAN